MYDIGLQPKGVLFIHLQVRVAVPHGRGGSRQVVLESAEDLEVAEGSFAYCSDVLTSAGPPLSQQALEITWAVVLCRRGWAAQTDVRVARAAGRISEIQSIGIYGNPWRQNCRSTMAPRAKPIHQMQRE